MSLDHINNIDSAIRFTVEGNQENGSIPFLDTLVKPEADNSLSITVYHKPAYTDQYVQWDSHHNLSAKYTLTHRAKTVCISPELFQREIQPIREALGRCKYPGWAMQKAQSKYINSNQEDSSNNNQEVNPAEDTHKPSCSTLGRSTPRDKSNIGNIVIPYTKGLGESFQKICGRYGVHTHFKSSSTLKQLLVRPKDQDPKVKKSGVIYSYQCGDTACSEEYIRETSRTLGERYWEHLKQLSPIYVHIQQTGHNSTLDNFSILGREDHSLTRTIKEAIYIRVNNPTLNRNIGNFNLNHIWDSLS